MKMFDKKYIKKELHTLNQYLKNHVNIYIIGGGAMSFYDIKTATKDIDIILTSESETKTLISALLQIGYNKIEILEPTYQQMKTRDIIENSEGFRWDIFVNKVCGGLSITPSMTQRAKPFEQYSKLSTFLLAPEDIFIFKAVTSRPRDREDMFTLFSNGLNIDLIRKEIQRQTQLDEDKAWAAFFFIGLDELVSTYDIVFPGYEKFLRIAEGEMLEKLILEFIQRQPRNLSDLSSFLKIPQKEIKPVLEDLIKKKKIEKKQTKYQIP